MSKSNKLEEELKSKTEIKQEMRDLQAIGVALIDLPESVYKKISIPEDLDEAIQTYKKIKSHNAQKRQRQYIGRLMRGIDSEPLITALKEWKDGNKKLARDFNRLEQLRLDLLQDENKQTIDQLITDHPECDRQQLMQLIRAAQKEHHAESNGKNFKKLFRFLKELATPEAS